VHAALAARDRARAFSQPNVFPFARPAWPFAAPALTRGYPMLPSHFGAALARAMIFARSFTRAQPVEAAYVHG
jgi:hypothetical protein